MTTRENKPVALVTGSAAPRIGRTVVEAFAARSFAVVVHAHRSLDDGRQLLERLSQAGVAAQLVAGDLRDELAVRRIVDDVVARFGRIDALVNCAAIWKPKPLEETTADDVREHFEANTLATFLCCQQAGLVMTGQAEGGAIVNVGDWAIERPYTGYSAYFPSKGAIPALTRMFAVELAQRNPRVRVNAVLPGPAMLPDHLPEAERRQAVAGTLVGREGTPEHVAQAVLALVENTFITGVCLTVDGGRTIHP